MLVLAMQKHTGYAAIENALIIDERGSKPLETVFSIVIFRQSGDKWQLKILFQTTFIYVRR